MDPPDTKACSSLEWLVTLLPTGKVQRSVQYTTRRHAIEILGEGATVVGTDAAGVVMSQTYIP